MSRIKLWLVKVLKIEPQPYNHLVEQNSLIIKAARRCAYDLRHCADQIPTSGYKYESPEWWQDNANRWVDLFTEDGAKNYRHSLHLEVFNLEIEIKRLSKLLDENGIEHEKDIPF